MDTQTEENSIEREFLEVDNKNGAWAVAYQVSCNFIKTLIRPYSLSLNFVILSIDPPKT